VLASAPTSTQIALFSSPAAAESTIRARRAIACPVFCAWASETNSPRSAAVNSIATAVLPIAAPHDHHQNRRNFAIRTLAPF
jgi:hypothetical protein